MLLKDNVFSEILYCSSEIWSLSVNGNERIGFFMVDSGMNFRCVLFFGIVVDSTLLLVLFLLLYVFSEDICKRMWLLFFV